MIKRGFLVESTKGNVKLTKKQQEIKGMKLRKEGQRK